MHIEKTLITALFLTLGATTFAQPGSLDSTFGTTGKVTTDFGPSSVDDAHSIAIQPDGKIVVAGYATGDTPNFALARYDANGALDTGFGMDGKVTTAFGPAYFQAWGEAVALQQDGKIVVAGYVYGTDYDMALARYNPDGTLDSTFDGDGKVTTAFGETSYEFAQSVAIQPDGKIIVGGNSGSGALYDLTLVRYNTDGSLDNTFDMDGIVTTVFGTNGSSATGIAIQPDGKIVAAGDTQNGSGYVFAVGRYNTDGTLDSSFGTDGKVTTVIGETNNGYDIGRSVAIQPDGKIVVAGESEDGPNDRFAMARYNTDGALDNTFDGDGKVTTVFGMGAAEGTAVTIQADGKIIMAGTVENGSENDFALVRYTMDGNLDNSFGTDGRVTTDFAASEYARAVAIQQDGKIVAAGTKINSTLDWSFAVARYISGLNLGILDLSIVNGAPLIYPNPIDSHATLEYSLQRAETLTIRLLDMQGKAVQTFIDGQDQAAGAHRLSIDLPKTLQSGTYLIVISSPKGKVAVQVVK